MNKALDQLLSLAANQAHLVLLGLRQPELIPSWGRQSASSRASRSHLMRTHGRSSIGPRRPDTTPPASWVSKKSSAVSPIWSIQTVTGPIPSLTGPRQSQQVI